MPAPDAGAAFGGGDVDLVVVGAGGGVVVGAAAGGRLVAGVVDGHEDERIGKHLVVVGAEGGEAVAEVVVVADDDVGAGEGPCGGVLARDGLVDRVMVGRRGRVGLRLVAAVE